MKNKLNFPQSNPSKKRFSRKKKLSIVIGIFIVICAALGTWWFVNAQQQENTSKNKDKEASESKDKKKSSSKSNSSKDKNNSASQQQGLPENSSSSTAQQVPPANLSVEINDFNQANRMVQASAIIGGSPAKGSCVFTFTTDGAKPVVRQVASTGSAGPQTCAASIPEVEFTKLGAWKLNVTYYVNNSRSEANRDVVIQ